MEIEYRHPTEAVAGDIADVINRSDKELKHHTDTTADRIRVWIFGDKDFDPAGHLLGYADGRAVAYADTMLYREVVKAGLSPRLSLSVVPEWRGKGIEEHLLDFSIGFLRSKGISKFRFGSSVDFAWKRGIAAKAGMTDVRHSFHMICPAKGRAAASALPMGYSLRSVMMVEAPDNELGVLVDVLNDAFSENWSFFPETVDIMLKIRDEQARTGDSESRITFAMQGDEAVGAIISTISRDYNQQHGRKAGILHGLGVGKPHRRSGLGRMLLSESMAWLWDRGMDEFHLGVDAENAGALGLYKSLGFAIDKEGITYEMEF